MECFPSATCSCFSSPLNAEPPFSLLSWAKESHVTVSSPIPGTQMGSRSAEQGGRGELNDFDTITYGRELLPLFCWLIVLIYHEVEE